MGCRVHTGNEETLVLEPQSHRLLVQTPPLPVRTTLLSEGDPGEGQGSQAPALCLPGLSMPLPCQALSTMYPPPLTPMPPFSHHFIKKDTCVGQTKAPPPNLHLHPSSTETPSYTELKCFTQCLVHNRSSLHREWCIGLGPVRGLHAGSLPQPSPSSPLSTVCKGTVALRDH